MDISEEAKTYVTIKRHITLVQKHLYRLARVLEDRALVHDLSKFNKDEYGGFVQINKIARKHKYGSPEYKASLKEVDAVDLHYSRNSHHPEHYKNGVGDMSFFDIVEMVVDWKAASEAYGNTSFEKSLIIQVDRFNLTAEQIYLIELIARELE